MTVPQFLYKPVDSFAALRKITLEIPIEKPIQSKDGIFFFYQGLLKNLQVLLNMHLDKLLILFTGG